MSVVTARVGKAISGMFGRDSEHQTHSLDDQHSVPFLLGLDVGDSTWLGNPALERRPEMNFAFDRDFRRGVFDADKSGKVGEDERALLGEEAALDENGRGEDNSLCWEKYPSPANPGRLVDGAKVRTAQKHSPLRPRPVITQSSAASSISCAFQTLAAPPTALLPSAVSIYIVLITTVPEVVEEYELALDLRPWLGQPGLEGRRVDRPDRVEVDRWIAGGEEWMFLDCCYSF